MNTQQIYSLVENESISYDFVSFLNNKGLTYAKVMELLRTRKFFKSLEYIYVDLYNDYGRAKKKDNFPEFDYIRKEKIEQAKRKIDSFDSMVNRWVNG